MSQELERAEIFRSVLFELSERRGCDAALTLTAMPLARSGATTSAGMMRHSEMVLIVPGEMEEANSVDE